MCRIALEANAAYKFFLKQRVFAMAFVVLSLAALCVVLNCGTFHIENPDYSIPCPDLFDRRPHAQRLFM